MDLDTLEVIKHVVEALEKMVEAAMRSDPSVECQDAERRVRRARATLDAVHAQALAHGECERSSDRPSCGAARRSRRAGLEAQS